jgi:hypothetical protein
MPHPHHSSTKLISLILATVAFFATVFSETQAVDVSVKNVRPVFNNGEHNAFTDLTWFKGHIYLTFRSCPDGHMVFPTSQIIVLKSSTGKDWSQVHSFSVKNRDTRDPHFAQLNGVLFVYTGTWYCGPNKPKLRNINQMVGYGVSTQDGKQWSTSFMLEGTYGHYVWRTATYNNQVYMCARRTRDFAEVTSLQERSKLLQSRILASDDGKRFLPVGTFQEKDGDETAFMFDDAGTITAIARRGRGTAELITLSANLQVSTRRDLDRYIGGPFIGRFGDHTLVAGRNIVNGVSKMVICTLNDGKLENLCELPAGGDCSYPGMIQLCPGCVLVSYYSSHETDDEGEPMTNIYLAELEF